MSLDSMADILQLHGAGGQAVLGGGAGSGHGGAAGERGSPLAKMLATWQAMADASDSYTGDRRSVSGLVGGDGLKMRQYAIRGKAMSGGYVSEVIAEAPSAWRSPTPVCAASWRLPRREPAACCRRCCCPCASMRS